MTWRFATTPRTDAARSSATEPTWHCVKVAGATLTADGIGDDADRAGDPGPTLRPCWLPAVSRESGPAGLLVRVDLQKGQTAGGLAQ